MKKTLKTGIAVVALAITGASYAANPGTYVGLGLGASRLETPTTKIQTGPNSSYSYNRGGLGGRLFAGYNFNNYFGVEAGVAKYANSKYKYTQTGVGSESLTYSLGALDVVGKAYLPFSTSGFNAYALAGAAVVNSKVQDSGSNTLAAYNGSTTTRKVRPVYGVGVSYDINSNVTTNLEATRIQGLGNVKTSDKAIPNADMISLNIAYNFG